MLASKAAAEVHGHRWPKGRGWVDDDTEDGATASTVGNRHGVLHSIMAYGSREMSLPTDNPCAGHGTPPQRARPAAEVFYPR